MNVIYLSLLSYIIFIKNFKNKKIKMLNGYYKYNPLHTRGADIVSDKRLCLQGHDDYFNCLDSQNTDSNKYSFKLKLFLFKISKKKFK